MRVSRWITRNRVAGLVMLAPVAYPWPGGVGRYNKIVATPVIGPLLAYTITLPLGLLLAEPGARGVFLPQTMPPGFVKNTATPLLLRPREFLANARDLVTLKAAVAEQAPRYAGIKAPITIISGDEFDKTVSTKIHSRPLAEIAPNAKLIVLPGVGHMIQNAAPDLVISEIEAMVGRTTERAVRRGQRRGATAANQAAHSAHESATRPERPCASSVTYFLRTPYILCRKPLTSTHGHDRGRNPAASSARTMCSKPGAIAAVGAGGQSADGLAVCDPAALVDGARGAGSVLSQRS